MMSNGSYNSYFWFQWLEDDHSIQTFLKKFSHHLEDKYVCVSASDSGKLALSDDDRSMGWEDLNNDVVSSPALKMDFDYIPTFGFDEWYFFTQRPSTIRLSNIYVNYTGFNLSKNSILETQFWQDIEFNRPLTYISEGNSLTIVTSDNKLSQDLKKYWC